MADPFQGLELLIKSDQNEIELVRPLGRRHFDGNRSQDPFCAHPRDIDGCGLFQIDQD
jgi:hypothetical protein